MSEPVASLEAVVQAKPLGFDEVAAAVRGVQRTMQDMAAAIERSFAALPGQMAAALSQQERTTRESADRVVAIREQLADREAKLTMSASEYRTHLLKQEGERMKELIEKTVKDRAEAEAMILQNTRHVEEEITRVQRQELDERTAAAERAAEEAARAIQSRRSAVASLAGTVGLGAGGMAAGLAMDIDKSKDATVEFDASMRNVNSILQKSGVEFQKLKVDVLALSEELKRSPKDLADGLTDIASSGYEGADGLNILKNAAISAKAGITTTAVATDALTSILGAYNRKASESQAVSDELFQIVNAGKISFKELAEGLGQWVPQASAADLSLRGAGAALAGLTLNGIPAAQAANALGMLITKLASSSDTAKKAAHEMGVEWMANGTAQEHIKQVGLAKALEEIGKATQGNIAKMRLLLEEDSAVRAALSLTGAGAEKYAQAQRQMGDATGAATRAYAEQAKAARAQSEATQAALERARISMGEGALVALAPFSKLAEQLLNTFNSLPGPVKTVAGLVEVLGAAALAAGAGIATFALGAIGLQANLVTLAATGAITAPTVSAAFTAMGTSATSAMTPIGAVLLPLLPIIGALALAAAALYAAWQLNLGGIREFTELALKQVQLIFQGAVDGIQAIWGQVAPYLEVVWEGIKRAAFAALGILDGYFRGVFAFWGTLFKVVGAVLTGNWSRAWEIITQNTGKAVSGLWDIIQRGFKGIASFIGDTVGDIGKILGALWEGLTNPSKAAEAQAAVGTALDRIKGRFADAFYGLAIQFEAFSAKGEELWAGMGKLPDAPKPGASQAPAKGGAATTAAATSAASGKDTKAFIEQLDLRRRAHQLTTEQMIAELEKYKQAHKLAGDAALAVDAKIGTLRDQLGKAGEAGRRKEAEAVKRQTDLDLKAIETRDNKEQASLATRIGHLKQFLATHQVTAEQRIRIENRIAELTKQLDSQTAQARAKQAKELSEVIEREIHRLEGRVKDARARGTYVDQRAALDSQATDLNALSFRPMSQADMEKVRREQAENHRASEELERQHVEAMKRIDDALFEAQDDSLAKRLESNRRHWEELRKQALAEGRTTADIDAAEEKARNRVILDYAEQMGRDLLGVFDKLADGTATPWAKIQAVAQAAFGAFRGQMADFAALTWKELTTKVIPAVLAQIPAWTGTGTAATGAAVAINAALWPVLIVVGSIVGALIQFYSWAKLIAQFTGFDAWTKAIEAAAGALDMLMGGERPKKLALEIQKLNAGIVKNRQERADAELAIALKELEDELFERKKAGATEEQVQALRLAKQRELYAKHEEDQRQILRDGRNATYELLAELADLEGDKDKARAQRRAKEEAEAQDAITEAVKAGNLTEEQAEQKHQADMERIRRKYLAEEIADREEALQRQLSLEEKYASARAEYQRGFVEQQRAIGAITDEQLAKSLAEIDRMESEAAMERAEREAAEQQRILGKAGLSAEQRAEAEAKYSAAVQKLTATTFQAMRKQLDDYKKEAESKYQSIQDAIERERRALTEKKDAEARAHRERMAQLEEEEKVLNHQLFLIDEQIRKIKERADADRKQLNDEDRAKFAAALAQVQLGGDEGKLDADGKRVVMGIDNLTYEGIDAQLQAIQNKRDLEEITAQEALTLQSEIYVKKAALAQLELNDQKITFGERAKAEARKAEAYKAWQAAQLEMLDQREQAETKVQEASKTTLQHQLADLNAQKEATQNKLNEIDAAYRKQFENLQKRYDENKLAWDKMLDGIKTGTDAKVKEIVAAYKPLEDRLVSLIGKANELATANARAGVSGSGGSSGGGQTYSLVSNSLNSNSAAVAQAGVNAAVNAISSLFGKRAGGGYIRGGTPGVDSVPILGQDGEYVIDTSLTARLQEFLGSWRSQLLGVLGGVADSWRSLLLGAQRDSLALAGRGSVTIHAPITIRDVAIREEADIDRLAVGVAERVSETIARDWYR